MDSNMRTGSIPLGGMQKLTSFLASALKTFLASSKALGCFFDWTLTPSRRMTFSGLDSSNAINGPHAAIVMRGI